MKGLNWAKIFSIATRVVPAILSGVQAVEAVSTKVPRTTGADKKAAVLEFIHSELASASLAVGKDLSVHGAVMEAAGNVVDTVVAFHDALAEHAAEPE
jgi:hypothetical protein